MPVLDSQAVTRFFFRWRIPLPRPAPVWTLSDYYEYEILGSEFQLARGHPHSKATANKRAGKPKPAPLPRFASQFLGSQNCKSSTSAVTNRIFCTNGHFTRPMGI
jgi:hypothetical protein